VQHRDAASERFLYGRIAGIRERHLADHGPAVMSCVAGLLIISAAHASSKQQGQQHRFSQRWRMVKLPA
jgi:hypothetical protein